MKLSLLLEPVRTQLSAAAALGDDRTREIAATLSTTIESAVRLAVLNALTQAGTELTDALHQAELAAPGLAVAVHLAVDEIRFSAIAPPAEPAEPPPGRTEDGDATARISLRLTESLKTDIEGAAGRANVSVNSWLVRAATAALRPDSAGADGAPWAGWSAHSGRSAGRISGWVTG